MAKSFAGRIVEPFVNGRRSDITNKWQNFSIKRAYRCPGSAARVSDINRSNSLRQHREAISIRFQLKNNNASRWVVDWYHAAMFTNCVLPARALLSFLSVWYVNLARAVLEYRENTQRNSNNVRASSSPARWLTTFYTPHSKYTSPEAKRRD